MASENINNNNSGKRILIAPLDWGLGHTTRIIPIIRHLINTGHSPIIACDATAKSLLQKEFTHLTYLNLPGYKIQYSKKGKWFFLKLLSQLPRVLRQQVKENKWVKNTVTDFNIDGIISDNRPSFFHKQIPSVYITHQLQPYSRIATVRHFARTAHFSSINKFQECWVPDCKEKANLAGLLSHPTHYPRTAVKYIGPLSRFTASAEEKGNNIVALLSGPEPQRSMLESVLKRLLKQLDQPALIIIGKPQQEKIKLKEGNLEVYNHMDAQELEHVLKSAKIIIARAGYSTIMDLHYLQKKAILIPTPGQSEQQYLAEYLEGKSNFVFAKQSEESILHAFSKLEKVDLKIPRKIRSCFEKIVNDFVQRL